MQNNKNRPYATKQSEQRQAPKGRGSKYAKKVKGRGPLPVVKREAPVFAYYVQGTDIEATKTPCERKAEDRRDKKFSESGLGTWKNPRTGKKCKVDRVRVKREAEVAAAA